MLDMHQEFVQQLQVQGRLIQRKHQHRLFDIGYRRADQLALALQDFGYRAFVILRIIEADPVAYQGADAAFLKHNPGPALHGGKLAVLAGLLPVRQHIIITA
ncbi:hypothetical protein D3C75_980920 [compost metagenome]